MESGLQEALFTIVGMILFFIIGYHYIKHLNKTESQFNNDATGMIVLHSGFGKTTCLKDMKNGYVILENREHPISKKYIKPVYF